MTDKILEIQPLFIINNLAKTVYADIPAVDISGAEKLTITAIITTGTFTTANFVLQLFYSPDGINWDTTAFGSSTTSVYGNTSTLIGATYSVPFVGFMKFKIGNTSTTQSVDIIQIYCTLQPRFKDFKTE